MKIQTRASLILALAVLVLLLAGCSGGAGTPGAGTGAQFAPSKNSDGYADITVEQLASMLDNKDFTLVNVHIPYEGELPKTDLFIAYNTIEQETSKLPDKNAPIVLYCNSGSMSTTAARALAGLGYDNILELDGGFSAWRAAGYDLLDKPQ